MFLPGKFHGQKSEAGYSPWSHKESDTTERLILWTLSSILDLLYKMLVIGSIKHIHLLSHICGGSKSKSRFFIWVGSYARCECIRGLHSWPFSLACKQLKSPYTSPHFLPYMYVSMSDFPLFSSVHFSCSVISDSLRPYETARQASLSVTNSQSPPKPISIVLVMPSNHLILCRPLRLLPSIFPSIKVFSNESALCIRWPKY